jgi:20S proteasome subunit alpha 3
LKDDYKEDCSLKDAVILACQVLAKSMDSNKPDVDRFEIGVVTKEKDGSVV